MSKNISDDNRYEHGAVRSNAGMLIPVSGTEAAKQRSDAGTYTVCGTAYKKRRMVTIGMKAGLSDTIIPSVELAA